MIVEAPYCGRCKKTVDQLTPMRRLDGVAFLARCHGEQEVTFISREQFRGVRALLQGTAFAPAQGEEVDTSC